MNSLDFDDQMGGLMPQILALTAPPGARDNRQPTCQQQQQQQQQPPPPPPPPSGAQTHLSANANGQSKAGEAGLAAHPYFRRPGRGHNHDCCDACSEGGDLICCDLCPASFHLTCHDPPLDEDEIPTGEWACHQCRMGSNEDDRTSNSSSKSNKSSKPTKRKDKEESKPKEDSDRKVFAGGRQFEISNTPLSTLIKAAAIINPTQFTLPYELTLPANFPGEPKENFTRRNGTRRGLTKKKPYELDNGLVPLPAKLCFQCSRSCRMGPLIPCDFCPLFFHLDCLDPPLTTPPMGQWMCPNHPQHKMDTSLLTSHSLTERVRLWDRFSVPLDQDSVKLRFLQHCHRQNPPFRFKVKKVIRSRLRVPAPIKAHYEDPPDLLPHLSPSQYLPFPPFGEDLAPSPSPAPLLNAPSRTEEDAKEKPPDGDTALHEKTEPRSTATPEEKDEWLASLLSLQSSILRHMVSSEVLPAKRAASPPKSEPCNGLDHATLPLSPTSTDARPNFLNGDFISYENKSHKMCLDGMKNHISHSSQQNSLYYSENKKSAHKAKKNALSPTSLKSSRPSQSAPTKILSDTLSSLQVCLREKIEDNCEVSLSNVEQCVLEVLAHERLKQIFAPRTPAPLLSTPPVSARALLCPLVPDVRLKDFATKSNYSKEPVPMTFRILNIGKGSHNHVNFERYGHCNYISQHHASILFDQTTGHYELLNYSEYETQVDGVTYNCDVTERTVSQAVPPPFLQHVKAIIANCST